MKRTTYLAAIVSSFVLAVGVTPVAAFPPNPAVCPIADDETATECTVTTAHSVAAGTYAFHKTLHITGTGSIVAPPDPPAPPIVGITLNIDGTNEGAGGAGGALLMDANAALITANDTGATTNSASDITITTTGSMVMQAGSKISAQNLVAGGDGGKVTITVKGAQMLMCGPLGTPDLVACGGAKPTLDGAQILTQHNGGAGDTGVGGDITITVGPDATHGQFVMGGGSLTTSPGLGAMISAGSVLEGSTGRGGNIAIYAGQRILEEAGAQILSEGTTTRGHGGRIFLDSSCGLDVKGKISSLGQDPGADLVHLGSCEVHLFSTALVQSTGAAHDTDTANSCDNIQDLPASTGEVLRDHPANSTTCVEIWARHVIIDQGAEVNADFGLSGGSNGHGWIDIFAEQDIIVTGPPVGTPGDTPGNDFKFAVHANNQLGNPFPGSSSGGEVTVKAKNAFVTLTGQALQANQLGNGGQGGAITVQGSTLVNMDGATLQAAGDNTGGTQPPCDSGSGACGLGGTIDVRSFNNAITWQNGVGDVNPDLGPAPPAGNITLTACTAVTTTGTNFFNEVPTVTLGACGGAPTFPAYVIFNPNGNWNSCGENSIDGVKFNDLNGDGVKDPGEPLLPNWQIHITGPGGYNVTVLTDATGHYHVGGLAAGTYLVCEVLQATWTQTFPAPGVACGPGEGPRGYSVTVGNGGACCSGTAAVAKDFGNNQPSPPLCPEDPNRAALLTRTVDTGKPAPGSGTGNAGSPINYLTLQAAYNAGKASAATKNEVIGMFSKTTENVVLDNYTAKSMTITQCTSAQLTAADSSKPVWDLTANKKLLIIGPDSVGGTIGWYLETGLHELKSIRSNSATVAGLRTKSGANSNSISFNNVASKGIGIDILSNTNTLQSGTIGPNTGWGVHIGTGNTGNNVSGMTIQNNGNNGVLVEGNTNTITSNKLNTNAPNGIRVSGNTNTISSNQSDTNSAAGFSIAGSGNIVKDNKANTNGAVGFDLSGTGQKVTGSASNQSAAGVFDYRISAIAAVSGPSGNKADGAAIPSATRCTGFFTNAAVLTCK